MSGWLGGGSNARTETEILGGIRVQTSAFGLTIPVGYGRGLLAMNLGWYDNFKAIAHEERAESGKGGSGPVRTSYTYTASVIGLLCEGSIGSIRTIWVGKEKFEGAAAANKVLATAEIWDVPVSPYQVTVSHSGAYAAPVGVALMGANFDEMDSALLEGAHYTRSGGVYTFSAPFVGRSVRIEYRHTTATDAVSALERLGLSLKPGTVGQSVWPYLTSNYSAAAIGYSGIAYVYAQDYAVNNSAQIENHAFEIDFGMQLSASVPDCDPRAVIDDILLNSRHGVQFPSAFKDAFDDFSAYCRASGLLISPVYTTQRSAREVIAEIIDACNADAAWCGDLLKIIPRGDQTVTGNSVTYTPNNTSVFSVGPDDFSSKGGRPVRTELRDPADRKNVVTVEYFDRSQKYRVTPVTISDEAAIAMYGPRPEDTLGWRMFADGAAASQAAQIRLQRHQAAIAQRRLQVPWRFLQLEPGDLLTLNDPATMATSVVVKVLELTEGSDDTIEVLAEDFPIGHANAPLYAPQVASGWNPNQNIASGDVTTPMFFEPPGSSVGGTGLEVWIAATGADPNWGGCDVYASLDNGATYKLVSRIDQAARYGALQTTLAAGAGATLDVLLEGRGGKLQSTSVFDADALSTLCFVGDTATGEWLAYQTATLTNTNRYSLTSLRRGRYGSADKAFAVGARFAFIDSSIAQSGPLPVTMIGQVIKFKFCSYNLFGGALQSLSVAPEYAYKVTGRFMGQTGRPISANLLSNAMLDCTAGPADFAAAGGGLEYRFGNNAPGGDTGYIATLNDSPASRAGKLAGLPTNLMLVQVGTASPYQFARWPSVPCDPSKRYVLFVGLVAHRASGRVHIQFFDAAGTQIVSGLPTVDGSLIASDESRSPANAAHYRDSSLFVVPPADARSMRLCLIKYLNDSPHTSSGLYFTRPFLGEAMAEQTELPVWEAGGQNMTSTASILPGAVAQSKEYAQPAGTEIVVTSDGNELGKSRVLLSNSDAPQFRGPFTVDTNVRVSASADVSYGFRSAPMPQVGAFLRLDTYVSTLPYPDNFLSGETPMVYQTGVEYRARASVERSFTLPAGETFTAFVTAVQCTRVRNARMIIEVMLR